MCNVTAWRHSRLRAHWQMALVLGSWGRSMYSAFPGNCSVSYLSFVYGRSLWAELNGGENSLHWKTNMLPLFSIMTLWYEQTPQTYRIGILKHCCMNSFFCRFFRYIPRHGLIVYRLIDRVFIGNFFMIFFFFHAMQQRFVKS